VKIVVYDASGHLVETLIDQKQEAGIHYVQWNASGYPSGFYIYRIQADDFSQANKCMLIK
jgi:flagellar hook assembly protein FlgD